MEGTTATSEGEKTHNSDPMDIIFITFCLFVLWCSYRLYLSFSAKQGVDGMAFPPGPTPLPLIGNLLSLGHLPHRSLHELSTTYGSIIKLSLGRITTVVISSPSLAKEILQTHDSCFCNRFTPDAITAHDHNLLGLSFMPISPLFKTLRKIYNCHIFATRKLDSNRHLRTEQLRLLVQEVTACAKDGRAINISEAAFGTTLNLLSNTVFSVNLADSGGGTLTRELKELVTNIMAEAGRSNIADYFPALKRWNPQGSTRRMKTYFGRMFDILDEMIGQRVKARSERGWLWKGDVLDTLLDISHDVDEDAIDLVLIKHLFLDVFAAGTDTTSNTLEWAMTELLRSPEKLLKAQSELRDVIDRGNLVEESDLPHLPYLLAVIKETFRLHPPAPLLLPRIAGENREVGGYVVPKGAQVLVNVWGMGRDQSVWGKTACEFVPERFLGSLIDVKGHHFELLPFGGGRRMCPGLPLALRMLHVMLGSLLCNFDWKLEDGITGKDVDMDEHFGLTIQKAKPLKAVPLFVPA